MADDPYKYFRIEARELVELLGRGVLELEKGGGPDVTGRLLRHAHTLKGAARVVRQPAIADLAHSIEDVLAPLRDGKAQPDAARITNVLALIDDIARLVSALGPPSDQVPARGSEEGTLVVRAELGEMDALLEGIIETNARLAELRTTADLFDRVRQLADALDQADELRDLVRRCQRDLHAGLDHAARELAQVRESAEQLRLVSVDSLFVVLERAARDVANALGKQVAFEATGGDVRLDAHVLAALQGALVQLVRNAIAHGIEPERDRRAAKKDAVGRVSVDVARKGKYAVFVCRDDGRGLDLDAIQRVAMRRGVALSDVADASAALRVLLRGGISTTSHVTEVAGRGVGLDVVRAALEKLGGDVRVETSSGQGTTFEVTVPVSLASVEALAIDAGGIAAAVPLDAVRGCRRLVEADVSRTARGESVVHDGVVIPLLRLAPVLRPAVAARHGANTVGVVIDAGGRTAALAVDRLLGTASVIVRPIPDAAALDPIVAGAALDALGVPQLVLDPQTLVDAAHRERSVDPVRADSAVSILVIDDSLTTRMLEQSILQSAGYDVDTAVSGEDGLEAARRKRYALFLVDVEMPGIDGFTFVERVRADAALRDIPAILVTSRSGIADRLRGEQVGAQGYVVKAEFDQIDLLARIERLVTRHA